MKQRQYNAFEIEFKSHTLDKEEFLNMDETDKTNYLDFLTEKEIRLRERAENEKKRPKLVKKLNKDADKIHDFLQMINKEREQGKEERQENDEIPRNKKQQEARDSYMDPGINKQINIFIEQNGLEGHRIFYSRATGQLIDNSAAGEAIAVVKEKNGVQLREIPLLTRSRLRNSRHWMMLRKLSEMRMISPGYIWYTRKMGIIPFMRISRKVRKRKRSRSVSFTSRKLPSQKSIGKQCIKKPRQLRSG